MSRVLLRPRRSPNALNGHWLAMLLPCISHIAQAPLMDVLAERTSSCDGEVGVSMCWSDGTQDRQTLVDLLSSLFCSFAWV